MKLKLKLLYIEYQIFLESPMSLFYLFGMFFNYLLNIINIQIFCDFLVSLGISHLC